MPLFYVQVHDNVNKPLYRNWNECQHFLVHYFWATRPEFGLPDCSVGPPVGYLPIFVKFEPCVRSSHL